MLMVRVLGVRLIVNSKDAFIKRSGLHLKCHFMKGSERPLSPGHLSYINAECTVCNDEVGTFRTSRNTTRGERKKIDSRVTDNEELQTFVDDNRPRWR